jgi:hypothetical protein
MQNDEEFEISSESIKNRLFPSKILNKRFDIRFCEDEIHLNKD